MAEVIKKDYDDKGDVIYYDDKGNLIYFETSNGYWSKREYDDKGNEIYYENSYGEIITYF